MKANVGNTDKLIRIVLAIVFGTFFFTNTVTGILGMALLIFGIILIATSLISFCPIYPLLGINTCPKKTKS
ncbi:DUF2892 domain-containing protein [Flavobacterium sp.]|jgi:hypothetical protein|uniref:DUF2892 domain-containing protein n=1 Tax=Flavobacterium sp. TaxID=239 RepID=UPI0037C0E2D0